MLQGEHFAILLTFIKLPIVIKTFVCLFFELPFYTGFSELLEIMVLIIYAQSHSLNVHAKLPSGAKHLLFDLIILILDK